MDKRFTRDSTQKIQLIQHAFTELINETGYENLTTRQISKRANISVGIIYHYFKEGKPAIAASLYEENFLDTININLITGYRNPDYRSQVKTHLELHKQNKELYRAFDLASLTNSDIFSGLKQKRDQVLSEHLGDNAGLLDHILRVYVTIDAVIHRHLYIEPLFKSEKTLIKYLSALAETAYMFS